MSLSTSRPDNNVIVLAPDTMSTVEKAISLLNFFSVEMPEAGLSDIARLSGYDKATTRRFLVALENVDMIEQDAVTRRYRLGPGLSRLARLRNANFPFLQVAAPIARALADDTDETVHVSELSGTDLVTAHVEESGRANRVSVTVGRSIPLHATASGIVFLAFAKPEFVKHALRKALPPFTRHTVTDKSRLQTTIEAEARQGYGYGDRGYEDGVSSVAAPILASDGYAIGTIAVASPLSRVTDAITKKHVRAVMAAAQDISRQLFGEATSRQARQAR